MKRENNLPLSNVKLELVLQNWLLRELSKRSLTLPLYLQLMCGPSAPLCVTFSFRPYDDADRQYQIYQIFANGELFYWCSMSHLPREMVTMAGSLPPGWEDWYANLTDPPEISPTRADAWWVERWEVLRRNCADDASTDALIIFLRRVLVLNPALRPTAAEVL